MKYLAIIEIPKGCDRRIHMRYDGSGFEDFGPIKEKIPINDGIMPVHYGYIEDTITSEGDNVDVIIFSQKQYKTGDKLEIEVIGLMNRSDSDHKVIAKDESVSYTLFKDVPNNESALINEYFGYQKKITIESREKAVDYIKICVSSGNSSKT